MTDECRWLNHALIHMYGYLKSLIFLRTAKKLEIIKSDPGTWKYMCWPPYGIAQLDPSIKLKLDHIENETSSNPRLIFNSEYLETGEKAMLEIGI